MYVASFSTDQDTANIGLLLDRGEAVTFHALLSLLGSYAPVGAELKAVSVEKPGADAWLLSQVRLVSVTEFAEYVERAVEAVDRDGLDL